VNRAIAQEADTLLNTAGEDIHSAETDSIASKGLEMIDIEEEANKILQESTAVMMLDSLNNIPYFTGHLFTTDTSMLNVYNFPSGQVPEYDDDTYKERLEKLNRETPIELTYNKTVRSYIDLYAVKKRELTSKILGLKEIYFPIFEEYLDKYDMPMELKYLAVVESALNPTAGSRAGAKGLWQFMYYTGKIYGLKVTSLTDDRFDPYLATDAACRHMKDLYNIFGDWSLVMAAYNSGAGNVNKAIRRAGGVKNYWAIWPYLPRETRGYVPAFIAVTYVMNYAPEHNLYPLDPGILFNGIDTVNVHQPLAFDQVSEMLGVPMDDLKFLNPIYKTNLIPAYDGKVFNLRLPLEFIDDFVDNEQALYQYKSKSGLEKEKILAEIKKASERTVHIVRSGENLGLIANKYGTSVSRLKSWNGLRSNTIHPGQRLIVYPSSNYTYTPTTTSSSSSKTSRDPDYHIVRRGENLGLIAKKYGCSVSQLKSWNNLSSNTIHPDQKLKVYGGNTDVSGDKIIYYTVKKGDTLWDIAQQYKGVSVKDIQQLNNLNNASRLQPGQKLKIALKG
jgi:membrane-bound lytic murein transglycosylase D